MPGEGVVLLVEDNEKLNAANARALRLRGFETHTELTLGEARAALCVLKPDVILLDVTLPDGDGFDFCAEIKDSVDAHILFLTAKTEYADRVRGLSGGGDDYITKPFHPEELMARIESAMRRRSRSKTSAGTLTKGGLTLDVVAMRAFVNGAAIDLSPKEFAVLLLLARSEGKILSPEQLYEAVWNAPPIGHKNAVKTTVSRLRDKLSETDCDIVTSRGADAGYMFVGE
jgi:DNA-binding response OmpR family regulator